MNSIFSILFFLMFILFVVVFFVLLIKNIKEFHSNNKSPRLSVDAVAVAKRTDVSHQHHMNGGDMTGAHGSYTTSSTTYYITFEVESGDRMEFSVSSFDYGMTAEGDRGKLRFQGTRFLGFDRIQY